MMVVGGKKPKEELLRNPYQPRTQSSPALAQRWDHDLRAAKNEPTFRFKRVTDSYWEAPRGATLL